MNGGLAVAGGIDRAVNLSNVRMVQCGERPRFPFEAGKPVGVGGKRAGKHLERDVAAKLRIARAVDLPHAARAQCSDDFVRAEMSAWGQRHGESW